MKGSRAADDAAAGTVLRPLFGGLWAPQPPAAGFGL